MNREEEKKKLEAPFCFSMREHWLFGFNNIIMKAFSQFLDYKIVWQNE